MGKTPKQGVTLRLSQDQLDQLDRLVAEQNLKGGPHKSNRQTVLAYCVDRGLREMQRQR
jgi:hypothetical protein